MEIEHKNLEMLFLRIPYDKITDRKQLGGIRHDYSHVDESLYLQYAHSVFPNHSEDEWRNHYARLLQDMKKNPQGRPDVFRLVMNAARRLLVYNGKEIMCQFDEMLCWREISFQLGQDIFTCAFMAAHDLEKGLCSKNFSWPSIIRSDNSRLHHILKQGMAENHFHLTGSAKVFELNWICLMNLIEGRIHDFQKLPSALQVHPMDRIRQEGRTESFYAECQRAAFYRVYLFAVLKENDSLREQAEEILGKMDRGRPPEGLAAEIQDMIVLAKHFFGAKTQRNDILDYAFEKDMAASNDRECYLLAGERRFLYECCQSAVSGQFTERQKNLFYKYLSIRTHFRGELIQVNKKVGFANFSNYQDRKEVFIEGQRAYEDELVRLALNETRRKQNIVSLEARICPKKSAAGLYHTLAEKVKIAAEQDAGPVIYVLHFPKIKDSGFCPGTPRNGNARAAAFRHVRSIVAMLEQDAPINEKIRGIDACSSELNCRPEVFAQIYRYLLDMEFPCGTRRIKLHATYHAGEDFLDIADGLRAIDEAVLFCGLKRGSRIGHGLAMGIEPHDYYEYKGYKLIMPKQVLLDDTAWVLCKADEAGCSMDRGLKSELTELYDSLYEEIYMGNVPHAGRVSVRDYCQSWMLRGDNPDMYRLTEDAFNQKLKKTSLQRFERYAWNENVNSRIRKIARYRNLYFAYHYHRKVREKGEEQSEFKTDARYADVICQLQDNMIQKFAREGIGIETNPSSNYLIGTICEYEKHPLVRFHSRKLRETKPGTSLSVSVNTDDQGVFDTLLENEYALMALALKKAVDDKNQLRYDIENIYEWIDSVRRMGIEQIFG